MRNFYLILLLFVGFTSFGQTTIKYQVNPFNLDHHEIKVTIDFSEIEKENLEIRMPNSSPGRYAIHNFAKNLYGEKAYDQEGNQLTIQRLSPSSWAVPVVNGAVRFEYILFANHADGTYAGFDAQRIHMNMPAAFAYGVGLDNREVELYIDLTEHPEWSVATQIPKTGENTFRAPNYYYFYDSPTVAGSFRYANWKVEDQTIEIAMMHDCSDEDFEKYVSWTQAIVEQERAVYGELPRFDYKKYTFICSYSPYVFRDAMEHRNSTICTFPGSLEMYASYMISSLAHEFFHSWNIERIRPASLEPFDFDHANMSGELWFGEGFTNYYEAVSQCRAGVMTYESFLENASNVLNRVKNSPAREFRNPIQMSYNAPYVDAAASIDATNYPNNFISYYTYGELLGLALDLSLRSNLKKLTLDDYMQYVWSKFGKTEIPYTIDDLQEALGNVTGDQEFANNFFDQYIYQSALPDFETLYDQFGIKITLANPGKVNFGSLEINNSGYLTTPVLKGTDLYPTGIDKGDRILSLNDQVVTGNSSLKELIKSLKPNENYTLGFEKMGEKREAQFSTSQDPTVSLQFEPNAGKKDIKNREAWLGPK